MANDPILELPGIGEKTEFELKKSLPRDRRGGDVTEADLRSLGTQRDGIADVKLNKRQKESVVENTGINRIGDTRSTVETSGNNNSGGGRPSGTDLVGDFIVGDGRRREATEEFNELPENRREADKEERARVTTDFDQWNSNKSGLDFPGVDTPKRKPREEEGDLGFTINDL